MIKYTFSESYSSQCSAVRAQRGKDEITRLCFISIDASCVKEVNQVKISSRLMAYLAKHGHHWKWTWQPLISISAMLWLHKLFCTPHRCVHTPFHQSLLEIVHLPFASPWSPAKWKLDLNKKGTKTCYSLIQLYRKTSWDACLHRTIHVCKIKQFISVLP
jgi:hypothetical protein